MGLTLYISYKPELKQSISTVHFQIRNLRNLLVYSLLWFLPPLPFGIGGLSKSIIIGRTIISRPRLTSGVAITTHKAVVCGFLIEGWQLLIRT